MASGLATCLAMTWQACAFIAAAAQTRLVSTPLQWTRSFLTLCQTKAKQGCSASVSRIVSVFKACTGQTARANKMTADLQLVTAERDGLATKLQVLHRLTHHTIFLSSLQIICLQSTSEPSPCINAATKLQSVCSAQMQSNATVSSSDLHCSRNSRGKTTAILHGQSV